MNFLLDTNIVLHYIRRDAVAAQIDTDYSPFLNNTRPVLSVVVVGEIKSIALQNGWGANKLFTLDNLLRNALVADINTRRIIARYAEIDAYSQNKLPARPLPLTARNMGKNDLWIAATASVLGATLLTTDPDFEHLNGVFLPVAKISA